METNDQRALYGARKEGWKTGKWAWKRMTSAPCTARGNKKDGQRQVDRPLFKTRRPGGRIRLKVKRSSVLPCVRASEV